MKHTSLKEIIRNKNIQLGLLAFLVIVLIVGFVSYFPYSPGWDFRNNLYLPVHLLVQNQSPYNIHVLVEGSNAIWMPGVLGAFFPLGYFSLQQASNIWWLINLTSLFAMIWMASGKLKPDLGKLIILIPLLTLFPSTVAHFDLGQITILITCLLVVLIRFRDRIPTWLSGLILALSLTKPQLVVFVIPSISLLVYKEEGVKQMAKLWAWTLTGLILLTLPVFLFYPDWLPDLLLNFQLNKDWAHPNLYNVFSAFLPSISGVLYLIFFGFGLAISAWIVQRVKDSYGLFWILAITPIFTPYIWSWDFVLMYPLLIFLIFNQPSERRSNLLLSTFFLVFVLYITQKLMGIIGDFTTIWVPNVLLLILVLFNAMPTNNSKTVEQPL